MTALPKMRRESDKHLIDAASGVAGMAAEIIRLKARISELEANQRTVADVYMKAVCELQPVNLEDLRNEAMVSVAGWSADPIVRGFVEARSRAVLAIGEIAHHTPGGV